jgi:peptidoglycan/LPS O-acetylase OafA/YrhL
LDGVRGMAILMVMLFHLLILQGTTRLDGVIAYICGYGWLGVELFFVLSGYLITGILYDAKGEAHYFRNFYARRTLRIFPLYYAVLFLVLVILPHMHLRMFDQMQSAAGHGAWFWLYLSNFYAAYLGAWVSGILDPTWSLAVEEQFYLCWPLIVLLCSRRTLVKVSLAAILLAPMSRALLMHAGWTFMNVYPLTTSHLDGLGLGALIALVARGPRGLTPLVKMTMWAMLAVAAAGVGLSMFDEQLPSIINTWSQTSFVALFGGIIVLAVATPAGWRGGVVTRLFTLRSLRFLGKYSYALYLFHLPVEKLVRKTVFDPQAFPRLWGSQLPGQISFWACSIGLALIPAVLSWNLFEKHFLKLKRYFPAHPRQEVRAISDAAVAAPSAVMAPAEVQGGNRLSV